MAFDPVNIPSGGKNPSGRALQAAGAAATGVVVTRAWNGRLEGPLTRMMQGYAEDLAGRGLFALMPSDQPPTAQQTEVAREREPEFANAAAIAALLKLEGTDVKVCEHKDATHGFASPSAADTKAAVDSRASTLKFFQNRLGDDSEDRREMVLARRRRGGRMDADHSRGGVERVD